MSKIVTARIPDEIYEQGVDLLNSLGSSTTELINAAFDFIIQTGSLPVAPKKSGKSRTLNEAQKAQLARKLDASSLKIELPVDWDYKEELAWAKRIRSAR